MDRNERKRKIVSTVLDCFAENGLLGTTTREICAALNIQSGGLYYYFDSKEDMVLTCAAEALRMLEMDLVSIAVENIYDSSKMVDELTKQAIILSPYMRFFTSVCASARYGAKAKPILADFASRYEHYIKMFSDKLGCEKDEIRSIVLLAIMSVSNYMIFGEGSLINPQIELIKYRLNALLEKYTKKDNDLSEERKDFEQ